MGISSGCTFPLAAGDNPPPLVRRPSGDENTEAQPAATAPLPLVLLIEDNPGDVYVIRQIFEQSGIPLHLQVASDGEDALDVLRECESRTGHRPSVILLDWNLPKASGAEVLAYARQTAAWQNVPIIVITSSEAPEDLAEIKRLGATSYFRKPSDLDAYMNLSIIVRAFLPGPRGQEV